MKDAVAFMSWERVVPWKILSLKARPGKRPVPVGFGSRNKDLLKMLDPGSRIWVVTRIANEMSLAGCVKIRKVIDCGSMDEAKWPKDAFDLCKQWPYVAIADPQGSEFFETNCAEPVMTALGIKFTQSQTIRYFDSSLQRRFDGCAKQGRKVVFLTYRWKHARRYALSLAKKLRGRGWSPWLDAMSLPKYTLKHGANVSKERLEDLIRLGIQHSSGAVVIKTDGYKRTHWTKLESAHIDGCHIPCVEVEKGEEIESIVEKMKRARFRE